MKLILLLLLTATSMVAGEAKCKGNPKIVGACFSIHGRITLGADTVRLRLWPVGTKRMLGVTGGPILDDADDPIYPRNLRFTPDTEAIYGNFEVCPFTQDTVGAMQLVCIESAVNVVVKRDGK
jgi:hypothetical protein